MPAVCSITVSATEINEGLEPKRDSLRLLQAREYSGRLSSGPPLGALGVLSWKLFQARKYPTTPAMPGPPLDATGVLTWKLLHFLVGQRPSAQEERGDGRLDNACQLARDAQEVISPSDWEIVREMITL